MESVFTELISAGKKIDFSCRFIGVMIPSLHQPFTYFSSLKKCLQTGKDDNSMERKPPLSSRCLAYKANTELTLKFTSPRSIIASLFMIAFATEQL